MGRHFNSTVLVCRVQACTTTASKKRQAQAAKTPAAKVKGRGRAPHLAAGLRSQLLLEAQAAVAAVAASAWGSP